MIGYYIHHVGAGHLQQAQCIAAEVSGGITGLSSLAKPPGWPGAWVRLPRDDMAERAVEPTACGSLHWAPLGDAGLRGRMGAIAAWISEAAPSVMMVDISVEVSALARLMGIPVVTVLLPGKRDDPPHRLGYALAELLIAPWPASVPGLLPAGSGSWAAKVRHVGAFSRFDSRPPRPRGEVTPALVPGGQLRQGRPAVLVLQGRGGSAIAGRDLEAAAGATPGWAWTVLDSRPGHWVDDPWTELCRADIVVAHAGLNAVAEIAAARKPAIIVPQPRPHGEQLATAHALARAGLAVTAETWPPAASWAALLRAALRLGGGRWESWSTGRGASQAARLIESAARHAFREQPCASL